MSTVADRDPGRALANRVEHEQRPGVVTRRNDVASAGPEVDTARSGATAKATQHAAVRGP
jgi:hypothetical protein